MDTPLLSQRQYLLMEAARSMGIIAENLADEWSQDAVRYRSGMRQEVIFEGSALGSTSLVALTIGNDLPITRKVLSKLSLPSPVSKVFIMPKEETDPRELNVLLGAFWEDGAAYTLRPAYEHSGHGLLQNLATLAELEDHLDTYGADYATWILEHRAEGEDLQLLVIGGKLVSAIVRTPLQLIGDGKQSLEELMDAYNNLVRSEERIEMNPETRQLLREQGIFLSDIVPSGREVVMKAASATSDGAKDVTENLHGTYTTWAEKIASETGLPMFRILCRASNPSYDPTGGAKVIRLDPRPDWLPFYHAEGGCKDIPSLILGTAFGGN